MASGNVRDLFDVKNRIALVTGGSSGLGYMIAQGLVSNGAKVYITALSSDPIDEKVAELNAIGEVSGGSAIGFPSNLMSKEAIAEVAEYISSREAHLDILISNAGVRRDPTEPCDVLTAGLDDLQASMWSHRYSDWEDTFRVNTTAHYFLSVALMKLLAVASNMELPDGRKGCEKGRGVVVITSSCASSHNATNVDLSSYAASKAATDHLVRLLASKFTRWYIRVNSINPGFVPSNMNPINTPGSKANIFEGLVQKVPAKRVGTFEDIAGTVLYLSSQAGAYVDGQNIVMDGGRNLIANAQ